MTGGRPEEDRAMNTAAFFAERKARGDLVALRRILERKGGEKPRAGDERA
jgi:hypothetical protein